MPTKNRLNPYLRLMRFDKPIGFLLLLWPTYWGLWLAADGLPSIANILIFSAGVVVMRSAGCVINDYADRDFDGLVKRTEGRPLANGELSPTSALTTFALLLALALGLVLLTNRLTLWVSLIAVILATLYPFMKRYTHLPQVVLGAAFSMSIPMAFAAEKNTLDHSIWLVYAVNLLWTVAYDTLYGAVDREYDKRIGVKSTAILFGESLHIMVALLQALALAGLFFIGQLFTFNIGYYAGLIIVIGLFTHQHWVIKGRDASTYFKAFMLNHWVGLVVLLAIIIGQQ